VKKSSALEVVLVAEQLRREVPGGIGTYIEGIAAGLAAMDPASAGQGPDERPTRSGPKSVESHGSGEPELRVRALASHPRRGGRGSATPGLPAISGTPGPPGTPGSASSPDRVAGLGLPVEYVRLPSRLVAKAWDLGLYGVRGPADVVHATSLAVPPTSSPLVATVHDLAWRRVPEAYPPRGRRWHEAALARTLARAVAIVVPSTFVADELRHELGPDKGERVVVIPEGADHLPEPDGTGAQALLEQLGVRGGFLLSVSTLEPRKNLARLIEAYGLARPSFPEPWHLVVVGPRGWGEGLASAVQGGSGSTPTGLAASGSAPSGVAPSGVVFAGRVAPAILAALYRDCRCLAYVPLVEGFGLPVVEAMRAGAPVVSSDVPSAGDATLMVDPLDPQAIAAGLRVAAVEAPERDALVAAGRRHSAPMTWEQAARDHVELWQRVAGSSRGSGSGSGKGAGS